MERQLVGFFSLSIPLRVEIWRTDSYTGDSDPTKPKHIPWKDSASRAASVIVRLVRGQQAFLWKIQRTADEFHVCDVLAVGAFVRRYPRQVKKLLQYWYEPKPIRLWLPGLRVPSGPLNGNILVLERVQVARVVHPCCLLRSLVFSDFSFCALNW